MGWNQLAAEGTEIHHIPGNHLTMLRKPHIQVLAAQIKASVVKLTREEWKSCNLDLVAK